MVGSLIMSKVKSVITHNGTQSLHSNFIIITGSRVKVIVMSSGTTCNISYVLSPFVLSSAYMNHRPECTPASYW